MRLPWRVSRSPARRGDRYDEILTQDALRLLASLQRELGSRPAELLAARETRQVEISAGGTLDFLPGTHQIREDPAWRVEEKVAEDRISVVMSPKCRGAQHLLEAVAPALGCRLLGIGARVDRRAVLRADVVALTHALRRVVVLPEHLEQVLVADHRRVEDHEDRLGVPVCPLHTSW